MVEQVQLGCGYAPDDVEELEELLGLSLPLKMPNFRSALVQQKLLNKTGVDEM